MAGRAQVFMLTLVDKGICMRHMQRERYMENEMQEVTWSRKRKINDM